MNTSSNIQLVVLLASVSGFLGMPATNGQNVPVLSISGHAEPLISVQGAPGSSYQLQYVSNLNSAAWQSLTNFTMAGEPFAFIDHAAISNQIRLYRALLLDTNAPNGYAPAELSAAEIYQFTYTQTGFSAPLIKETLVLNSATDALFLRLLPQQGVRPTVEISYERTSAFSAQLAVVQSVSGFPTSQTNYYSLFFTGPNTGFYQAGDGLMVGQIGQFSRNQSLVGQELAPTSMTPGQLFGLVANGGGYTTNLTISTLNTGILDAQSLTGPVGSVSVVDFQYHLLGPLAARLEIVSVGNPASLTNTYWLVYSNSSSGNYQVLEQSLSSSLGTFSRNDSFAGQQIAKPNLEAGEIIYFELTPFFFVTNKIALAMNSPTNAMLVAQYANPPSAGVFPVDIQYAALGPVSCQLDVVIPPMNGNPSFQTNHYLLSYSSTNGGTCQATTGFESAVGTFRRDRSLIGQTIASAELAAGEVYNLAGLNGAIVGGASLVVQSPTNAAVSWLPPLPGGDIGIFLAAVHYTYLGVLGARLEVVITPQFGNPLPKTNICYLAYLSTNAGFSQGLLDQIYAASGVGSFTRNQALIGQQTTPAQLSAGELYELIGLGNGPSFSNVLMLAITSSTDGLAYWSGSTIFNPASSGGLSPVTFNYVRLGPFEGQLELIFPEMETYPSRVTNLCTLVYSATDGGLLQVANGPQLDGGVFRRSLSLVGKLLTPLQLSAGASYQITSSNMSGAVITETILIDSPNTGILLTQGITPNTGIFPNVAIDYFPTNNLNAKLTAIIPPIPPELVPRTNSYIWFYTATNSGVIERVSLPTGTTWGRFQYHPGS